ncbi:hypothetical protein C5167_014770 [Papaver somniferum]|uniref:Macro domain-containing protein n=1 Tax=Papaver somniferum TaxID=3469 RepID=A0A4Y7J451_PAPSO|nr:uncharacterized protein LOC113357845 [Papaver somniferum]RZC55904.1 hypothetical protein C5167_014770 [Papaver somniferum]
MSLKTMRARVILARTHRPQTNPRNWFQYTQNQNRLLTRTSISSTPITLNSAELFSSSSSTSLFTTLSMASNGGGSGSTADDGCKVFKISSSSSLKIQRGDITKWSVNGTSDAIVNAANERMLGGGGVDGAIHRAAGPELRAACYTVPEVRPGIRCPKGEARITPGFKLPVSHVIHTVGPIYDIDNHPEVTLRNAYRNCIKLAKESNIDYIAFPAISCGVYGYPYEEAATIAISTVMESDGDFNGVHFVLFEDDVYNAWLEKANVLL